MIVSVPVMFYTPSALVSPIPGLPYLAIRVLPSQLFGLAKVNGRGDPAAQRHLMPQEGTVCRVPAPPRYKGGEAMGERPMATCRLAFAVLTEAASSGGT